MIEETKPVIFKNCESVKAFSTDNPIETFGTKFDTLDTIKYVYLSSQFSCPGFNGYCSSGTELPQ